MKILQNYLYSKFISLLHITQIRTKIIFLGAITLTLLSIISVNNYNRYRLTENLCTLNMKNISKILTISNAIQEIQRERGISYTQHLSSLNNKESLSIQRNSTDAALYKLFQLNQNDIKTEKYLSTLRDSIDNKRISSEEILSQYIIIVSSLLEEISNINTIPFQGMEQLSTIEVKKIFFAKEKLGLLRTLISLKLHDKNALDVKKAEIKYLYYQYNTIIDEVIQSNNVEIADLLKKFTQLETSKKTFNFVEESIRSENLILDPSKWFSIATQTIDDLQATCAQALLISSDTLNNSATQANRDSLFFLFFNIAISIIIAFFVITIVYSVYFPLEKITNFINEATQNDFNCSLDFHSRNEFGIIAKNINKLIIDVKTLLTEKDFIAYHDSLTGIYNRHKFIEEFNKELKRSDRHNHNIAFAIMDIDKFKHINDEYGHNIGDLVLKTLADVIKENIRETDCFARWGGEEFVLLLPETEQKGAIALAEKIRNAVEKKNFNLASNVTISIGVSTYKKGEALESIYSRADKALYASKEQGRNRVTFNFDD